MKSRKKLERRSFWTPMTPWFGPGSRPTFVTVFFLKQDLKQRNIQVTMLKRLVVSRLINWRIERDDALGTLFFTFVLLWLGGVRRRLHTWHPARFWFESEVEDCLVPVGPGTGLLVGCENEGCYMLLCWSLMHRSTLTSRVISKQKPLCVPGTQKLDL